MSSVPQDGANRPETTEFDAIAMAWRLAPKSCGADPLADVSCERFHRIWPALRRLGLITAPAHHGRFLQQALAEAIAPGAARVLVCGSADEATVEQVFDALDAKGIKGDVTVLDLCPTPLRLCQALAELRGHPITTAAVNILQYSTPQVFDVICTHSFLGYFDADGRAELMRKWQLLLRPGGRVITVNRVRPLESGARSGFGEAQRAAFVAEVERRARAYRLPPGMAPEALGEAAGRYADGQRSHQVRSREEIADLFEKGGFRVDRLEVAKLEVAGDTPAYGPTTPGGAAYATVVATRL